jgi:hypothetical protein
MEIIKICKNDCQKLLKAARMGNFDGVTLSRTEMFVGAVCMLIFAFAYLAITQLLIAYFREAVTLWLFLAVILVVLSIIGFFSLFAMRLSTLGYKSRSIFWLLAFNAFLIYYGCIEDRLIPHVLFAIGIFSFVTSLLYLFAVCMLSWPNLMNKGMRHID